MRTLHLIPAITNFAFISKRALFFAFSLTLVISSVGVFLGQGLNYGIDFKGGILMEVKTKGNADIGAMRAKLSSLDLGDVALQEFGAKDEVLIRIQVQEGGEKGQQKAIDKVKTALGDSVAEHRRSEFVGPQVSNELLMDGVYAVVAAMAAILIYIWFRFEWQFGICAIAALVHDVLSTIGLFSLLGLEFNLSTVAAVLTIAGYSINDTVVVFDRVRENIRRYKKMPLPELLNLSINETLSRTTMTSLSTLIAVFALYILGGEVISDFSLAMIWGITIGTYSSICVAVPLLLYMNVNRGSVAGDMDEAQAETA